MSRAIASVLEAAATLLERPNAWKQGSFIGKAEDGGACFCAMGALAHISAVGWAAITLLEQDLPATSPGDLSPLAKWNDAPGRTQAEVVALFRTKAAALRAKAAGEGV